MVKLAISSEYSEYGDLRLTGWMSPLYRRSVISPVVDSAGFFEERVERFAQRREPQAVVNHLGVIERELLLVMRHVLGERQRFQLAVRGHDQRAAGSLIAAARFHADEAVLDQVDAADAVLRCRCAFSSSSSATAADFCR